MEDTWTCLLRKELRTCAVFVLVMIAVKVICWARSCDASHVTSCADICRPLPPGNLGVPLFGETISFLKTAWSGEFFRSREAQFGPIFITHILGQPTVYISGASNIKQLFAVEARCLQTSWPASMRRLMGPGSVSISNGDVHKHIKRGTLKAMRELPWGGLRHVVHAVVAEHLRSWHEHRELEMYEAAKLLTVAAACRALLGVEVNTKEVQSIADDLMLFANGFFTVPINIPGTPFAKALAAKERLAKVLRSKLIGNNNNENHLNLQFVAPDEPLCSNSNMDDNQINLALELLFGGQETVSCAMTCAVMLLHKHPRVVDKMRHEVRRNFHKQSSFADKSCYDNLHYVNNVFKEIIRLYPPIGGGFRQVKESFEIGDYAVPRGWAVTYSIKSTHDRNTNIDDVTAFRPERWDSVTTGAPSGQSNYNYIPFGAGASACVGKQYAKTVLQMFLVMLVDTTDWDVLTKDPHMTFVPIVKPVGGLMVNLRPRVDDGQH